VLAGAAMLPLVFAGVAAAAPPATKANTKVVPTNVIFFIFNTPKLNI
jgi:hypothetical protein